MTDTIAPSDRFTLARAALFQALADVLPGRVYAYALAPPAIPAPPAVYVARHDSYMEGPTLWAAFTITAVADGANHAAQAMLDNLLSGVFAAVTGQSAMRFESHTWTTMEPSAEVVLPAAEILVSVATGIHGFVAPVPHTALIPPTTIPANGGT